MPGFDNDGQELFQKSNTSCTMFSTKCYKVTWAKPESGNMHQPWMHNHYGRNLRLTCPHHPKASMKGIDCMSMIHYCL